MNSAESEARARVKSLQRQKNGAMAGIGICILVCFIAFMSAMSAPWYEDTDGQMTVCLGSVMMGFIFLVYGIVVENSQINAAKKVKKFDIIRYRENLQKSKPKALFNALDAHIENLRRANSTTTEQVVVGHEKVDLGIFGETSKPQYSSRTRDVPEYQVEKAVLNTPPDMAELEIIRRGTAVLPDLIGKYRSGKNIEITKRILERLPSKKVGRTFEEYGMFEEAEQWFSSHGLFDDGKRVRNEMKINQTVIQGDYVDDRDTFVRDSVVNRSNIGASDVLNDFEIQSVLTPSNKKPKKRIVKRKKDDKISKIKELKELLDSGAISDEDYEKMKREIVG